jgi:predicted amidohydrolase
MIEKTTIAAVQMNPKIMQTRQNLDWILAKAGDAAGDGADLIVFPECALTGYVFHSREEALPFMETIPGPSTNELAASCKKLGVHIVVGLLEVDGDRCFNAAVLIGPAGLVGRYRKNHLPFLGVDRFLDRGDGPFPVYQTPVGKIGIHICYDAIFPESARVMTLLGADILALPTNWPEGRGKVPNYVINTRAYENKVHFVATDRVGEERGTRFIGKSKIVDAWGDTLAQASGGDEETIYAQVKPADARQKRVIFEPGKFEMDFIGDRRPELYGAIGEPQHAPE